LITAKDHASIQIRVADVDADGKAIKGQGTTIAICGRIRAQGDSDDSINRIATKEGREYCSSFPRHSATFPARMRRPTDCGWADTDDFSAEERLDLLPLEEGCIAPASFDITTVRRYCESP
jgi:hypothetical protein